MSSRACTHAANHADVPRSEGPGRAPRQRTETSSHQDDASMPWDEPARGGLAELRGHLGTSTRSVRVPPRNDARHHRARPRGDALCAGRTPADAHACGGAVGVECWVLSGLNMRQPGVTSMSARGGRREGRHLGYQALRTSRCQRQVPASPAHTAPDRAGESAHSVASARSRAAIQRNLRSRRERRPRVFLCGPDPSPHDATQRWRRVQSRGVFQRPRRRGSTSRSCYPDRSRKILTIT